MIKNGAYFLNKRFSSFKALYPNYKQRVQESFDKQTFMQYLGAEVTLVQPGKVDLTIIDQPTLKQQHNFFHMGITTTLADTAAGYAAYSLFPDNTDVLTTGILMSSVHILFCFSKYINKIIRC